MEYGGPIHGLVHGLSEQVSSARATAGTGREIIGLNVKLCRTRIWLLCGNHRVLLGNSQGCCGGIDGGLLY